MDTMKSSTEQEKASSIIIEKANDIVNKLEGIYPILSEAIDRLGGKPPSPPGEKKLASGIDLPHVDGDSFLFDLHRKVIGINELVGQYEQQISRLNTLI